MCRQLIRQFELPLNRKIKTFSRGMKVKAALLSSLSYRPELVILDEPFTGLDALVRDEFIRGLLELSGRSQWTILVASHDIDEVERLADWVGVIDKGEEAAGGAHRLASGPLPSVRGHPGAGPGAAGEPLPDSWLLAERAGQVVRFVDSRYREKAGDQAIRSSLPGLKDLTVRPMSLKAIFLALARTFRLYE